MGVPLTREDWIRAGRSALEEGGPARVAVSPLAQALGATRGSFYWHFTDRNDLLRAVLVDWERRSTDGTIEAVLRESDPRERLHRLFTLVLADPSAPVLDVTIAAHADDPIVGPILERVTRRRVEFVEKCFADLGFGADATARARVAYAAFIGWLQMRHIAPALTSGAEYHGDAIATLIASALTNDLSESPGAKLVATP
jgi:AcrR family transcriptional regulator